MADAKKEAAPAAPAPAEPQKSSKLMPILVGLNSLLLFGVLGFMAYSMMHKPPAAAPAEHAVEESGHGEEGAPSKEEKGAKEEKGGAKEETKKGEGKKEVVATGAGPGPMVRLPDFIVHLRNPDLDRYARITFDVEVIGEQDKELVESHMPRVRDAFIGYLSDRTVEELRGSEGLARTKDALQQKLRELVPDARFRSLYISDFVVQ